MFCLVIFLGSFYTPLSVALVSIEQIAVVELSDTIFDFAIEGDNTCDFIIHLPMGIKEEE